MSTKLVSLRAEQSVAAAADAMLRNDVSTVFVVDKGRCVGMVSQRDLLRAFLSEFFDKSSPVGAVMSEPPAFLRLAERYGTLVNKMARGSYDLLPVLDANNHPVGTVSTKDLVIAQSAHLTGVIPVRDSDIISSVDDVQEEPQEKAA